LQISLSLTNNTCCVLLAATWPRYRHSSYSGSGQRSCRCRSNSAYSCRWLKGRYFYC